MRSYWLSLILIAGFASHTVAQTSSLAYPGTDGRLVYEKFPNQGEDTMVNIIPDFSFAGYMQGGVPLPENVPVKIILEPSGTENDSAMIQDAINQVSLMPLNEDGFRGAVLLKKGLYKVNGALSIEAGGVVLRGEDQLPADHGGTELLATAERPHSFINIRGELVSDNTGGLGLGKEIASYDYPAKDVWILVNVKEGVTSELANDSIVTFVFYSIVGGNFKFYSKENGDSDRIPYLEIITYSETLAADDTLKIYPSDDTYVRGLAEYRNTIYGSDDLVYYKKVDPEVARIGFLKFNLAAIPDTFKSATLNLLASREDQSGVNYIAFSHDDDWNEETRTWNNTFGTIDQNRIVTKYVGTGSRNFVVEDASSCKAGDEIIVRRTPNQLWCDTLGMSKLSLIDPEATDWTPESYTIDHPRRITAVLGDTIWIDIPVVDPMQELYGGGEILMNTISTSLQNSAVENMYISSVFKSETDEEHGWDAIKTSNVRNCWVKNVTARYFGYSCVDLEDNTSYCTIQDCALLDPKSLTEGGRKYPFPIHGGIGNLIQRCYARGGRHSFATHSRLTGPHVFLDCYATENYADIGPHHRWAAGILYDNIYGGQIRVQNRLVMGTGHGWAGVQNMFWNCYSYKEEFKVESPLGGKNWGIGCIAQAREGAGWWESYGVHVQPRSLYLQQLKDRLGQAAVLNVTTREQREGNIWDGLASWSGNQPTGIKEDDFYDFYGSVKIYPNPADDFIWIDLSDIMEKGMNIELYTVHGKCLFMDRIDGGKVTQVSLPESISHEIILIKLIGEKATMVEKISIK